MRYIVGMEPDTEYKTANLARRFNVHANTVRDWSNRFEDVLSKRATAGKRTFTYEDALILATVAEMRDIGLSFEAIKEAVDNGQRADVLPELPTKEETEARESVALVPMPEYERSLDTIKQLTEAVERARQERDRAEGDRAHLQERVIELERNLAAAKARVEIIETERPTSRFWLAVILIITLSAIAITAAIVALIQP